MKLLVLLSLLLLSGCAKQDIAKPSVVLSQATPLIDLVSARAKWDMPTERPMIRMMWLRLDKREQLDTLKKLTRFALYPSAAPSFDKVLDVGGVPSQVIVADSIKIPKCPAQMRFEEGLCATNNVEYRSHTFYSSQRSDTRIAVFYSWRPTNDMTSLRRISIGVNGDSAVMPAKIRMSDANVLVFWADNENAYRLKRAQAGNPVSE